jgi:hypothetical protein
VGGHPGDQLPLEDRGEGHVRCHVDSLQVT